MVWHVGPTSVITFPVGTIQLFSEWWNYTDGLFFVWYAGTLGAASQYKWYNMADNPANWYPPATRELSSSSGYHVWFDGAARDSTYYRSNFAPTSSQDPDEATQGAFNKMQYMISYNTYTNKRVAMSSTIFVADPSTSIWYPCGTLPFAWTNGRELSIGEQITFGSDVYRVFPGVFSPYRIWQAYRTA
jgi:hypothetical protein